MASKTGFATFSKAVGRFKGAIGASSELEPSIEDDQGDQEDRGVTMATHFNEAFWGTNGYDCLHRYIKQGKEFCREFVVILQERAEIEKMTAKKLESLSSKAKALSNHCIGTLSEAWMAVRDSLEAEATCHRSMQSAFLETLSKPLKTFVDEQSKVRKPAEEAAQKAFKAYTDRRKDDNNKKSSALSKAHEYERLFNQLKTVSGPQREKIETKCRKAEEALIKADQDYRDQNRKLEETRQNWEKEMYQCCSVLEGLELERLKYMKEVLEKYSTTLQTVIPVIQEGCDAISSSAKKIEGCSDVARACTSFGTGPNIPEQILYEAYEENFNNNLDESTRMNGLDKKMKEYEDDLQRERKILNDVLSLFKTYIKTPGYADDKAMETTGRQLFDTACMANFLRGNHFKLSMAASKVNSTSPPPETIFEYISHAADKSGRPISLLRIPLNHILDEGFGGTGLSFQDVLSYMPTYIQNSKENQAYASLTNEGWDQTDSNQWQGAAHDYCEIDEDEKYVCQARALYPYEPQQSDELLLEPNDMVNVLEKVSDDWWKGELNGRIGMFPATYVEEQGSGYKDRSNGNGGLYAPGLL